MTITVSLVEDNPLLASELQQLVAGAPDMVCLDVYGTVATALEGLPVRTPEILLVDLRLPDHSGVDLIAAVSDRLPDVQCVVLTMYEESDLIFSALQAGACGYLLKRTPPEELLQAIRQVQAGGSVITPKIARRILEIFPKLTRAQPEPAATPMEQLSERELSVLKLLVSGRARKQIVDDLALNIHTLDYTIRSIYRKLRVNCLAAAISVAVKGKIVRP
ncbi:response regulator transcription factor [Verrucomicrobium sp. BvORR034]|jgi:DNA-binding NarL/FixJ family response regulator|uniref:response regulator transcription factor n=1 Tax=Verrucomicrobium sp. BvORR034 TaxID=1396418 RepID=UPI0006789B11|nr:response regulator transcription factor [Verrucomicrobium sp. BvORR034]